MIELSVIDLEDIFKQFGEGLSNKRTESALDLIISRRDYYLFI